MPQAIVQKFKRRIKTLEDEVADLQEQSDSLEFIRDLGHVFDALMFYSSQAHLTNKDRESIRVAMAILARGGGN